MGKRVLEKWGGGEGVREGGREREKPKDPTLSAWTRPNAYSDQSSLPHCPSFLSPAADGVGENKHIHSVPKTLQSTHSLTGQAPGLS